MHMYIYVYIIYLLYVGVEISIPMHKTKKGKFVALLREKIVLNSFN